MLGLGLGARCNLAKPTQHKRQAGVGAGLLWSTAHNVYTLAVMSGTEPKNDPLASAGNDLGEEHDPQYEPVIKLEKPVEIKTFEEDENVVFKV